MKRARRALVALLIAMFSIALLTAGHAAAEAGLIDIHVGSVYFEDATVGDGVVHAQVGDQIRFNFDDDGAHTADVDELDIHTGIQDRGASVVTAPLTTAGTFELYCNPHRDRGHVTTLVVDDGVTSTASSAERADSANAKLLVEPGDDLSDDGPEALALGVEPGSEVLPVGVTEPDGKLWLRSVWIGLFSLVPIAGLSLFAGLRSGRQVDR